MHAAHNSLNESTYELYSDVWLFRVSAKKLTMHSDFKFPWFPLLPPRKFQDNTSIRQWSLPSKSLVVHPSYVILPFKSVGRARSEPGGTRWGTGGEVKGKLVNGVGSQYSHATSERGLSSITQADAHNSATSSRLNWRPHRFKWTRPFRWKTKSGFYACAITFRTRYINL